MPTSSFRVRFALVAVFAVLALGFLLSPSQAQPGRPPGGLGAPPLGFSGRPPGGVTGMPAPGGIHGIHGTGIHGTHGAGVSGMGGTPGTGFGGHGIHGGGTPGAGFGPPRSEVVWRCSKCNFELGRGPVDPGQPSCPACGVRFDGGTIGRFGAVPPAPTVTTPEVSAAPPDNTDSSSSEPAPASSDRARTIKLIGIVCGSILLLGALAALGVVVANATASKPARHRPTRRRIYDDE